MIRVEVRVVVPRPPPRWDWVLEQTLEFRDGLDDERIDELVWEWASLELSDRGLGGNLGDSDIQWEVVK